MYELGVDQNCTYEELIEQFGAILIDSEKEQAKVMATYMVSDELLNLYTDFKK